MSAPIILSESDAARFGASATVREIAQQPLVWARTAEMLRTSRGPLDEILKPILERSEVRIILCGAGTSHFAGRMIASVLSEHLSRKVEAIATTEIVARPREAVDGAAPVLLISFARSGNSPESVAAAKLVEDLSPECFHLVLTCNPDGALARHVGGSRHAHVLMMPPEADDQGFAMTSSLTSMMLAAIGALAPELLFEQRVQKLADAAAATIAKSNEGLRALASRPFERVVYLGSGCLRELSSEACLKILELTAGKITTHADSPLGFRHGPKALLNDRTLALVFISADPHARRYDRDIIDELVAQIGRENVVAIAAEAGEASGTTAFLSPELADEPDWARQFVYLVHAQLLGLHKALALGLTPDNPFPSGEVNRVVQGVTIHPFS